MQLKSDRGKSCIVFKNIEFAKGKMKDFVTIETGDMEVMYCEDSEVFPRLVIERLLNICTQNEKIIIFNQLVRLLGETKIEYGLVTLFLNILRL